MNSNINKNILKFIFDTNVFNSILDENISLSNKKLLIYVTEIQMKEILKTNSLSRKEKLLDTYKLIDPKIIESKTAIWGDFPWGMKEFGAETKEYKVTLEYLNTIWNKSNNKYDALIAEVAILYNINLVTSDKALLDTMLELNKLVISFEEFKLKFIDK